LSEKISNPFFAYLEAYSNVFGHGFRGKTRCSIILAQKITNKHVFKRKSDTFEIAEKWCLQNTML
jgi:hypothetical protein